MKLMKLTQTTISALKSNVLQSSRIERNGVQSSFYLVSFSTDNSLLALNTQQLWSVQFQSTLGWFHVAPYRSGRSCWLAVSWMEDPLSPCPKPTLPPFLTWSAFGEPSLLRLGDVESISWTGFCSCWHFSTSWAVAIAFVITSATPDEEGMRPLVSIFMHSLCTLPPNHQAWEHGLPRPGL